MKFGHFDDKNREYVIDNPRTPWPWINYLGNEDFFGQNLNEIAGLTDAIVAYLDDIKENGMREAVCKIS